MTLYTIKSKYVNTTRARLHFGRYGDGSLAIQATEDGVPLATLSINLGAYLLTPPEGHIFVPDYSEHEGLPEALAEAGIAAPIETVTFGPFDTTAMLMRLTIEED